MWPFDTKTTEVARPPEPTVDERIAKDGFSTAMVQHVLAAGHELKGYSRPPWEIMGDYITRLEARVIALESISGNQDR